MKSANVVIGANFGDEGKGRLTDHFARPGGLVVRFNGGPQAGHTVHDSQGRPHVFGHYGSGTFKHAHTYLSSYFVCNSFVWEKERRKLHAMGIIPPPLFVDREALLTTPYDMLLNQAVELSRGEARHGSCGMGINETMTRCAHEEFRTTAFDAAFPTKVRKKLEAIRSEWVPFRMQQLGLEKKPEYTDSATLLDNTVASAEEFAVGAIYTNERVIATFEDVVFEGAQGLLLDEKHHWFPHVTRSRTGLTNVLTLAEQVGIEQLEVTYVTRAYLTRHGKGPLPNELSAAPYNIKDSTNIPNDWQGSLRFAYLHIDLLADSVFDDLEQANGRSVQILYDLAVTCLDQVEGEVHYWHNKELRHGAHALDLLRPLFSECNIDVGHASFSPRGEVKLISLTGEGA